MLRLEKGRAYSIKNKNNHEIHYLHFRIKTWEHVYFPPSAKSFNFNNHVASPLIQLNEDGSGPLKLSIGNFAGRQEVNYRLRSTTSFLFTHVLAGAFEVEGRLLEVGDGLFLWDCETVEMEALSNKAVLIILIIFKS
jgi:quercetin 2,3-dioxygenase